MSLKDLIASDIDNVFFNTEEFADIYIIDGRDVPVVQDDNRILEKSDISALGTALGEGLIFIKEKDMPRLPSGGEEMNINNKKWYVRDAKNNKGVYEIRIGRERVPYG